MTRTHQLYRELQEARIQLQAMRVEIFKLRKENTALKADNDSLRNAHAADVEFTGVEAICMDARQYESLSVGNALQMGLSRYGGAMKKLSEKD